MGFKECCSGFFSGLPDPALPLLPSFVLGTMFSALFLMFVYKKQSNLSLKEIAMEIGRTLLCVFPKHEHSEMTTCQNPGCIRCQKYRELEVQAIHRYEDIKSREAKFISSRIEDAIRTLKEKNLPFKSNDKWESEKLKQPGSSSLQKPTLFHMKNLAANSYWSDFDIYSMELGLLRLNFDIILAEFEDVFNTFKNGNSKGWKLNEVPQGHWCIYPFIDQGIVNEENCKTCPNTATLVGSLPSVMKDCIFGNSSFSILYPDSQIEPHYGPTNLRLRCHLGLNIPSGCWLEVAGKQYNWEYQKTIVFDDSFEHSAVFTNQESSVHSMPRAILMIDFWHPDITTEEKKVLLEILAP